MATKHKYITREFLESEGACTEQLLLFDAHFPDGKARVTQKLAAKLSNVFDWDWIADQTLRDDAWYEYDGKVLDLYDDYRRCRITLDTYRKKMAATWARLFLQQESE